jgi:hypothetical protein
VEIDLIADAVRKALMKEEYKKRRGEEDGYHSGTSQEDEVIDTQIIYKVQNEDEGANANEDEGDIED